MIKQVIVVRKDLNMRKGKIAAQVAHAAMMFLVKPAEMYWNGPHQLEPPASWRFHNNVLTSVHYEWLRGAFTKVVPYCNSESELRELVAKAKAAGVTVHECVDNGYTEFKGVPTLTCAAFGPDESEKLDPITGHLPLL